jgi:palmitoyltransferase
VARFDHFCAWMNNDIGLLNYRYFLAFLGAHVLLCGYGCWLMAAMLAGELVRHGVLDATVALADGREVPLREAPGTLVQWTVATWPELACLCLFLALTCVLVLCFFCYHLSLAASNTTTNEAWKRRDLREWLTENAMLEAEAAEAAAEDPDAPPPPAPPASRLRRLMRWMCCSRGESRRASRRRRARAALSAEVKAEIERQCANRYDRGALRNFLEVLWPLSSRRSLRTSLNAELKRD